MDDAQNAGAATESIQNGDEPIPASAPPAEGQVGGFIDPLADNEPPAEGTDKEGQVTPAQEKLPDNFEYEQFKMPDGFSINPEKMKEFMDVSKEKGLKQEDAQRFLDIHAEMLQEMQKEIQENAVKQNHQWLDEIKSDPDFGGTNLESTTKNINKLLKSYDANGELIKVMRENGLTTYPPLFKMLARISKDMNDDSSLSVKGAPASGTKMTDQDVLELLWPDEVMQ